jgi:hypothetical protein
VRNFLAPHECDALVACALDAALGTDDMASAASAARAGGMDASGSIGRLQTSSAPRAQLNSAKLLWLLPLVALAALPTTLALLAKDPTATVAEVTAACVPAWVCAGLIAAGLASLAPWLAEKAVAGGSRTSESASLIAQRSSPSFQALVANVQTLLNLADVQTLEAPVATR